MDVDSVPQEALSHEVVAGNVLQLLKGVDLREFVLHTEAIVGVNICNKASHWSLSLSNQNKDGPVSVDESVYYSLLCVGSCGSVLYVDEHAQVYVL